MSINHDLPAPPLSASVREQMAESWLAKGQQLHGRAVELTKLLKTAQVEIAIWSNEKMQDHLAFAKPQVNTIFMRRSLQDALDHNDPDATFNVAHEFAHLVLHRGELAKPLKIAGNIPLPWKPSEERQEDQAWDLGRSIMLPRMFLTGTESTADVIARFNAPLPQVTLRLAQLRRERHKLRKPSQDLPMKARETWDRSATPRF